MTGIFKFKNSHLFYAEFVLAALMLLFRQTDINIICPDN